MDKKLQRKFIFIAVVIVVCILGIISFPRNFQQLKENVRNRIRLGLDLKGGTHLILQVQVEDAVNITTDQTLERLRDELKAKNIPYADIRKTDSTHILLQNVAQEKSGDLEVLVRDQFPDWDLARVPGDPASRALSLRVAASGTIRNNALQQAMSTIRNRIDQLGVSEPTIAEYGQGDYEMVIQLPGVDDPTRVKDIMQSTALLE